MTKAHFFFILLGGGGGSTLIYIFKFVLSLCNQNSISTFDLRFALLVPPQSENASYAPEQDCAISNQHWVSKFEEKGWDLFLIKKKTREIIVLCRIHW